MLWQALAETDFALSQWLSAAKAVFARDLPSV
jgi:hypothetical protein